jgi:signal transduction histidine kinase
VLFLHLLDEARPGTLDVWLPMALRTVGALLIVAASLAGHERVVRPRLRWRTVFPWAALGVALFALWLLRDLLPVAVGGRAPASAQRPVNTGHPVLLSLHAFTAVCFMLASLAFTREASRRHDALLRWLGPACALGAFARVNYVLIPSLYSDWLRTGCYLLLLVGAAREIGEYWSAHARVAVLDDRRRLAREIHDGLVQELAYIRAETQLAGVGGSTEEIVAACDRALDEARAAVDALGRSGDEPLGLVLHRGAQQVAERYGARLEVDLDDSVTADVDQRHALVRIAREAVANAVRHGEARRVHLRLTRDEAGCRLVVEDDGRGFDPAALPESGSGFGLTSMREGAAGLPGSFVLDSQPGRGTTVGVTW